MRTRNRALELAATAATIFFVVVGSVNVVAVAATPAETTSYEVVELANEARAEAGLAPLTWSKSLAKAAGVRAEEIQSSYSHTRPDGSDFWTVDSKNVYGENLSEIGSSAKEVFDAWMACPAHRANLLDKDFSTIGVAFEKVGDIYYWAQEFGY